MVLKKPVALVFIHLLSVNNGKVQKWCHSILEKRCGAILYKHQSSFNTSQILSKISVIELQAYIRTPLMTSISLGGYESMSLHRQIQFLYIFYQIKLLDIRNEINYGIQQASFCYNVFFTSRRLNKTSLKN